MKFIKVLSSIADFFAWISGFFLFATISLIISNVVKLFLTNKAILITPEYCGYFMVAIVMFSLAFSFKYKAHIRITFLVVRLPDSIKKFFYFLNLLIAFLVSVYGFYYAVIMVYKAYIYQMRSDTVAQTLLWIPQTAVPLGFFLLAFQIFLELILFIFKREMYK